MRVTNGISHYNKKFLNFHYKLQKLIESSKNTSDVIFKLYNKFKQFNENEKVVIEYFNTNKRI
jgi:hypothetical protein